MARMSCYLGIFWAPHLQWVMNASDDADAVGRGLVIHRHVHVPHAWFHPSAGRPLHAHVLHGRWAALSSHFPTSAVLQRLRPQPSTHAERDAPAPRRLPVSTQVLVSLLRPVHARRWQRPAVGRRWPAGSPRLPTHWGPSRTISACTHVWPRSQIPGQLLSRIQRDSWVTKPVTVG